MADETGADTRDERAHFVRGRTDGPSADAVPPGADAGEHGVQRPQLASRLQTGFYHLHAAVLEALAVEWARGTAFVFLPVLLGSGALVYFLLPHEPDSTALVLGAVVLAAGAALAGERFGLRLAFIAALAVMLGLCAGKLETWRADSLVVGSDVATHITGRVARIEHQASGRVRLTIDLLATEDPQLYYPPERVRVSARHIPPDIAPGSGLTGLAFLMSPSGPVRPGGYDFSFNSYFEGLGAVGFFMGDPERHALAEPVPLPARLSARLEALRAALAARVRDRIDGPEGEVAAALIAGVRAGIPEEINEALRRSGLGHVLAISGLHMALVALTVMGTIRAGFALFPGFASRRPVKKYAAAAALCACAFYLCVSGAAVAAQRSFVMLAVMLGALFFDRAAITMRNLAIAALVVLSVSPHEVVGPSFQMSFAATMALIAGYSAWNARREWRLAGAPPRQSLIASAARVVLVYGGGLALTSLIAGTATALYGVWQFQRASPLALAANVAAMPFVTLVVMPSAVLSAVLMPFGLDGPALWLMGKGISAVIAIAQWVSARSPIDATGAIPALAVALLTAGLIILALTTTRLRLAALPLFLVGALLMVQRDLPEVLVSEDGRLVAMRLGDGPLAVNRPRPNGFTIDNWLRALKASTLVKPEKSDEPEAVPAVPDGESGFACDQDLCLARHAAGAVIAHAADVASARPACSTASLLVIDDATVENPCGPGGARVITKRELARGGSAAAQLSTRGPAEAAEITFAMREPWRPWHTHRAYSRAARGLRDD